ncbi:hypothetical protein ACGFIR_25335 [Micromonospora sp. NPDC049051]|uniref:hypothetical protein n=1 Tax=unclassified Micromonospora TaxID=2617518 RepID=UPI00371D4CCD
MNSPCGNEEAKQSNAFIYREGRFDIKSARTVFQAYKKVDGACVWNTQARSKNLVLQMRDQIANKDVVVGSIHWPTVKHDVPEPANGVPGCAGANAKLTAQKMATHSGSLYIAGGDANAPDRAGGDWTGWYNAMRGTHGYADAAYNDCSERHSTQAAIRTCALDEHWTIGSGSRRIDYLFAKRPNGVAPMGAEHTITFNEGDAADKKYTGSDNADLSYSDHRAIRARVHY